MFANIGCASCHIPQLDTYSTHLQLGFPEIDTEPFANEYFSINLTREFPGFEANGAGGIAVPLYADLKRHDMGEGLAEADGDATFTTARLWGIADTAPYLHDGRAPDLQTAIELHGGEAQAARDAFVQLGGDEQLAVLEFLRTLRTPESPNADLFIDEAQEPEPPRHHHDRPRRRWLWWR